MLPARLNVIRFFVHEIPPRKSLESLSFNIQFFDSELTSSVWWSFTNDPTKQNFLQISPGRRRVGSRPNNVKTGKTLSSWNFLVFFALALVIVSSFSIVFPLFTMEIITSILTPVHVSSETRKGIPPSCSCTSQCAEEIEWDLQVSWSVTTDWNTQIDVYGTVFLTLQHPASVTREHRTRSLYTLSYCILYACPAASTSHDSEIRVPMALCVGVQPFLPSRLNVVTHSFDVWEEIFVRALLIE